jgi:copper homeostasis protein
MLADTESLIAEGVDGIVFGILKSDGTLDEERCAQIMKIIGNKKSVFHRAIDVAPDWRATLDGLINLGVTRVLTSGQCPSAHYGMDVLRRMTEHAKSRIEILAACGFNTQNVREIVEKTGVNQIHIAFYKTCSDTSANANPDIYFGGALYPPENNYSIIDAAGVNSVITRINP